MCGRFVNLRKLPEWRSAYPIDRVDESFTEAASFNVAPSQAVPAIVRLDGQNVLKRLQWGLVPFWARDAAIGSRLINARAETVTVKPAFRNAFRKRRCLILADGFYEWKALEGHKQPMFITPADGSPLAFAGVWEAWDRQGRSDTALLSCAILTTQAGPSIRTIHERMPVVLKPSAYPGWLSEERVPDLDIVLTDWTLQEFNAWPVSSAVNSTRNNSPRLIERL